MRRPPSFSVSLVDFQADLVFSRLCFTQEKYESSDRKGRTGPPLSLNNLPLELIDNITSHLPQRDQLALGGTSFRFLQLTYKSAYSYVALWEEDALMFATHRVRFIAFALRPGFVSLTPPSTRPIRARSPLSTQKAIESHIFSPPSSWGFKTSLQPPPSNPSTPSSPLPSLLSGRSTPACPSAPTTSQRQQSHGQGSSASSILRTSCSRPKATTCLVDSPSASLEFPQPSRRSGPSGINYTRFFGWERCTWWRGRRGSPFVRNC